MDLTEILSLFVKHGLPVSDYCLSGNGYAIQFYTDKGPVVNLFNTGRVQVQGTNRHLAQGLKAELEKAWPLHLADFRRDLRQQNSKLLGPQ